MNNNGTWCRLPYEVMQDERLTISAAATYAVMLDRAKDGEVNITAKKVAELTGQPQRSVERAIKQLKDTGYITKVTKKQGGSTIYTLKKVIEDKKRKSEQPKQLTFDIPDSSGTFETDLTPEQVRKLSELISTKLSSDNKSPARIDKLLRSEYARAKACAKEEIINIYAYLLKTISKWEPEAEEPNDFDVSMYDFLINDFDTIKKEIDGFDVEKAERVCINNFEVI